MINNVLERSGTMLKAVKVAKKIASKPKKPKDSLGLISKIARSIQGLQ